MRDPNSMRLVACRPGPDGKFFHVTLKNGTPDGTYWEPGVKIVVRTSSGWSLPRYVLTILHTVLWPRGRRVGGSGEPSMKNVQQWHKLMRRRLPPSSKASVGWIFREMRSVTRGLARSQRCRADSRCRARRDN